MRVRQCEGPVVFAVQLAIASGMKLNSTIGRCAHQQVVVTVQSKATGLEPSETRQNAALVGALDLLTTPAARMPS